MAGIYDGAETARTRTTKEIISNKAIVALKQVHGREVQFEKFQDLA